MSTAAVENNTESTSRRPAANRPRAVQDRTRRDLVQARQHTEDAVTDLIAGTTDALRTLLPIAALRPTDAVDLTFDLAEQILAGTRRVCTEIASIVESGIQGLERRAA